MSLVSRSQPDLFSSVEEDDNAEVAAATASAGAAAAAAAATAAAEKIAANQIKASLSTLGVRKRDFSLGAVCRKSPPSSERAEGA